MSQDYWKLIEKSKVMSGSDAIIITFCNNTGLNCNTPTWGIGLGLGRVRIRIRIRGRMEG